MNLRSRQLGPLLLLVVAMAFPAVGAGQLNPTVKVLPRPTMPVPPECVEGVAPQPAVRVEREERDFVVRETARARDMQPPPSATLRGELQSAIDAARQNDREAFRDSLARAKKILAGYPPGGERTAAENTIAVLDDIDRLWEFQFISPTGAFFEAGSDVHRMMARYPGYESFVRRQTIVDQNGVKFYPTHESRDFLAQETSVRHARMTGKPLPSPSVPATRPSRVSTLPKTTHVTEPKPQPKRVREARATTSHPAPRRARHKAAAAPAPPPTPAPTPVPPATTAAPAAAAAPPPVTTSELPPATTTTGTRPATTEPPATTTTELLTPPAPTMTTTTASTTEPAEPAKKPEGQGRNFLVPVLLILVGIGVLVLLFRSSS